MFCGCGFFFFFSLPAISSTGRGNFLLSPPPAPHKGCFLGGLAAPNWFIMVLPGGWRSVEALLWVVESILIAFGLLRKVLLPQNTSPEDGLDAAPWVGGRARMLPSHARRLAWALRGTQRHGGGDEWLFRPFGAIFVSLLKQKGRGIRRY